jgi:hypothetical protein
VNVRSELARIRRSVEAVRPAPPELSMLERAERILDLFVSVVDRQTEFSDREDLLRYFRVRRERIAVEGEPEAARFVEEVAAWRRQGWEAVS